MQHVVNYIRLGKLEERAYVFDGDGEDIVRNPNVFGPIADTIKILFQDVGQLI